MKNLTFKQAYKLFIKEANLRTPKHCTKDWQFVMKINCILGLSGLNNYHILDEYNVKLALSYLEHNDRLSTKNLFNRLKNA